MVFRHGQKRERAPPDWEGGDLEALAYGHAHNRAIAVANAVVRHHIAHLCILEQMRVKQGVREQHVARRNADRHGLEVEFMIADLIVGGPYDLIVSNPPYIMFSEWPGLAPEITLYEPALR